MLHCLMNFILIPGTVSRFYAKITTSRFVQVTARRIDIKTEPNQELVKLGD